MDDACIPSDRWESRDFSHERLQGQTYPKTDSRFLSEIPPQLIQHMDFKW